MSHTVHHHLVEVELKRLAPTQITVGLAEVESKRREWAALDRKQRKLRLARQWFPCVAGAGGRHYIVDHHHLGLALLAEGVRTVWVTVIGDLSMLQGAAFWNTMEFYRWAHPFDARGRRRGCERIPPRLDGLIDDPYRSLAGFVRGAGGYAKDATPFAEFLWADFLRQRLAPRRVRADPQAALAPALALARSEAARYLPGWAGAPGPAA